MTASPELPYQRNEWPIIALLFVLLLAAAELGFRRGRRVAARFSEATRSKLLNLPAPFGAAARDLFRQYIDRHLTAYEVAVQSPALRQAADQLARLQKKLSQLAQEVAAKNSNVAPTGQFINALSEVFDLRAKRDAERDNHVPESVLLLLFLVAVLAMELVGLAAASPLTAISAP